MRAGRDTAEVLFLDVGAGGDVGGFGCGAAVGGDGEAEEFVAVGHPLAGLFEHGVEVDAVDLGADAGDDGVGAGGGDVDDPELEAEVASGRCGRVCALDEGDVVAVRRPEKGCVALSLAGRPVMGRDVPSMLSRESATVSISRLGPLVCGLKRMPARRKARLGDVGDGGIGGGCSDEECGAVG